MTSREETIAVAARLMQGFAERTGLTSSRPPQRYLWTDAFAVCNFLELARLTGEAHHAELALRLVDQVHHVLGRYREGDARTGWLSGLGEAEGASHPTRGGLRIGKKLPERAPDEPLDAELEWDRDGQYFHYLTKWMHALDQVAISTRQPRYNRWARELAEVAHRSFASGAQRMVWKMSVDLSRTLVPSMGQHDPLDGLVTCVELATTASLLPREVSGPRLAQAIVDFATMLHDMELRTADPLGLGGLLADAWRVAQLMVSGAFKGIDLLANLLAAGQYGLTHYARHGDLGMPASRRLGFRELGLAIGLSAIELLNDLVEAAHQGSFTDEELRALSASLATQRAIGAAIVSFWRSPESRQSRTWSEHRDINEVMLATSLIPEGFLRTSAVAV